MQPNSRTQIEDIATLAGILERAIHEAVFHETENRVLRMELQKTAVDKLKIEQLESLCATYRDDIDRLAKKIKGKGE